MSNKLSEIQKTFGTVKKVGADGEKLINEVVHMIQHMDYIIEEFGNGLQSDVWKGNFTAFTSEEDMMLAYELYTIILEARTKISDKGI